jgi:hypothetical protein
VEEEATLTSKMAELRVVAEEAAEARRLWLPMPQSLALAMALFPESPEQEALITIEAQPEEARLSMLLQRFTAGAGAELTQMAIPKPALAAETAEVARASTARAIRSRAEQAVRKTAELATQVAAEEEAGPSKLVRLAFRARMTPTDTAARAATVSTIRFSRPGTALVEQEPGSGITRMAALRAEAVAASRFLLRHRQAMPQQDRRRALEEVAAGRTATASMPNRASRVTTARCISHTELVKEGRI